MATSVDDLCAQNVLTYSEIVDIILADSQIKKKLLEDKITSLSTSMCSFVFIYVKYGI